MPASRAVPERSAPPPAALLVGWEGGLGLPPAGRALALLAVARPDLDSEGRAALSVGARNAALLELRRSVLGDELTARADCPACGEALELSLPAPVVAWDEGEDAGSEAASFMIEQGPYRLRCRLPSAADLAELRRGDALELLDRCLLSAERDGVAVAADELPAALSAALAEEVARRDPLAELLLELACPACGHAWHADLDPAAFVWQELSAWAQRLLLEVHRLAAAYGWHESDILALPPARRRAYLDLLDGEPAYARSATPASGYAP